MKAIRAKTLRDWLKANFTAGELREIADYGAGMGWHGLTYYADTMKLYQKFADEIWRTIADEADDMGYANVWEFLSHCDRVGVSDVIQAENLFVWVAVEIIARRIVEG